MSQTMQSIAGAKNSMMGPDSAYGKLSAMNTPSQAAQMWNPMYEGRQLPQPGPSPIPQMPMQGIQSPAATSLAGGQYLGPGFGQVNSPMTGNPTDNQADQARRDALARMFRGS